MPNGPTAIYWKTHLMSLFYSICLSNVLIVPSLSSLQFPMSMSRTLENGAHHQNLDLSEEVPPHHHYHHQQLQHHQQQQLAQLGHHQHHQHLQHSNSLASTTAVGMGGGLETPPPLVVVPPPYSAAESGGGGGSDAPLELRGSLDCWACSVLVTAQNLLIAAINACLAGVVFGTILTPATTMVAFGFLCHSTVRRTPLLSWLSGCLNRYGFVGSPTWVSRPKSGWQHRLHRPVL